MKNNNSNSSFMCSCVTIIIALNLGSSFNDKMHCSTGHHTALVNRKWLHYFQNIFQTNAFSSLSSYLSAKAAAIWQLNFVTLKNSFNCSENVASGLVQNVRKSFF